MLQGLEDPESTIVNVGDGIRDRWLWAKVLVSHVLGNLLSPRGIK